MTAIQQATRHNAAVYIFISLMFAIFAGCNTTDKNGSILSSGDQDSIVDGDIDSETDDSEAMEFDYEIDTCEFGDDDLPSFDPTPYVDPMIGTSGDHGQLSPAASYPFGMVKLGPDSILRSHSGYDYKVGITTGFSHTRIDGVGCSGAGGDVRVLPGIGNKASGSQTLNKEQEITEPGYYAVELGDGDSSILAEMTVTAHACMHRYGFPGGENSLLLINFNDPLATLIGSEWDVSTDKTEISGWFSAQNVCNEGQYKLYFSLKLNNAFSSLEKKESPRGGENAILHFHESDGQALLLKIGFSSVDIASARNDRDEEIPDWDFENIRKKASRVWQRQLAKVEVNGGDEFKTLFYTMLYRTMLTPADITTLSGQYRGTDGEVHLAEGYRHYHGWSLWDTYRNKFALLSLIDPERSGEIMQSLVDLYNEGKVAWSTDNEPYPNVRTEHAAALLLDAHHKNIEGFDLGNAFEKILAEAETLPTNSPDKILETSYDYWVVAQIAKILEDTSTYETYMEKSSEYKELWTETFKVMGDDADTMHAQGLYEGTLWQYRWAVVHDIPGMIELDGGNDNFLGKLTQFFDEELYNHGNEPDIHTPFLFNYVGQPWRTQDLVRKLLIEDVNQWYGTHEKWPEPYHGRIYKAQAEGLIPEMDDDDGTMSAWFVFAALGLYPVTIGQPVYALTSPLFEESFLHLPDDKSFTILAQGVSKTNRYIQAATLNGEELSRAWLYHDEIANGGKLQLEMGDTPNTQWGAAPENAPPASFE